MSRRRYSSWSYNNYFHTPSVGEIERTANKALAEAKKKGLDYHPVVIPGNKIAHSWWGKSWCDNLERYADFANRLPRGRSYVRHNAVIDLQMGKGKVHGKVQGSSLYKVDIQFDPLDKNTEKELSKVCSEQIQNVEELVSGKFPETLKDKLFAKGGLFPSPKEIHFKCSCPDWASMCKHVAAVMYGIGARLDDEPIGFFDLRGIQTDDFVAKAVANKVEDMLQNAAKQSSRVIGDDQLQELFGLDLGGAMDSPVIMESASNTTADGKETPKRRGRPPKTAVEKDVEPKATVARKVAVKASVAEASAEEKPKARRGRPPKTTGEKTVKRPVVVARKVKLKGESESKTTTENSGRDISLPESELKERKFVVRSVIELSRYSDKVKRNLLTLVDKYFTETFGYHDIMETLDCSMPTASGYINRMRGELKLIVPVYGQGKGNYRFR